MNASDRTRFGVMLFKLADAFGEQLSDARVEIYFERLAPFPIEAVEAAASRAMDELRFFPRVAELLDRLVMPGLPPVGEAWAELQRALSTYLPGSGVAPTVPLVLRVVVKALGGWRVLAHLPADVLWQKFAALYEPTRKAMLTSGPTNTEQLPALVSPPTPEMRALREAARGADLEQAERTEAARKRSSSQAVVPFGQAFAGTRMARQLAARAVTEAPEEATPETPEEVAARDEREAERREKLRAQARRLRGQA